MVRTVAIAAALLLVLGTKTASSTTQHRPSKHEIELRTRAAVLRSNARLERLRVVAPNRIYSLKVQVQDPARYLKHRVNRVTSVINRLTNVQWRFKRRYFTIVDRSGRRIFWVRQLRTVGDQTWWYVRPDLVDCARYIDGFDLEIDPEHVAPPCPAR